MSWREHEHFKDWLRFVRKKLGWEESFIKNQVSSAMKSKISELHDESKVLSLMLQEPHNIRHINVYAFKEK